MFLGELKLTQSMQMEHSLLEFETGIEVPADFKEDLRRSTYEKHLRWIEEWDNNGEAAAELLNCKLHEFHDKGRYVIVFASSFMG